MSFTIGPDYDSRQDLVIEAAETFGTPEVVAMLDRLRLARPDFFRGHTDGAKNNR